MDLKRLEVVGRIEAGKQPDGLAWVICRKRWKKEPTARNSRPEQVGHNVRQTGIAARFCSGTFQQLRRFP